jgi:hypothetical protein
VPVGTWSETLHRTDTEPCTRVARELRRVAGLIPGCLKLLGLRPGRFFQQFRLCRLHWWIQGIFDQAIGSPHPI